MNKIITNSYESSILINSRDSDPNSILQKLSRTVKNEITAEVGFHKLFAGALMVHKTES